MTVPGVKINRGWLIADSWPRTDSLSKVILNESGNNLMMSIADMRKCSTWWLIVVNCGRPLLTRHKHPTIVVNCRIWVIFNDWKFLYVDIGLSSKRYIIYMIYFFSILSNFLLYWTYSVLDLAVTVTKHRQINWNDESLKNNIDLWFVKHRMK